MAQEKKGLIARMLEGKEKSEEYARSTLPTNRWQLFWDIFKGNFGKIFKVNLLILIFFIPFIAIIIFHNVALQQYGLIFLSAPISPSAIPLSPTPRVSRKCSPFNRTLFYTAPSSSRRLSPP